MATKTKTVTIKDTIKLDIFKHDNSKKNFKKEFTGLNNIKIKSNSKPDKTGFSSSTSFQSNPGSKPQPHKFIVKKKGSSIEISGSVKVKFSIKSGFEEKFDECIKNPLLSEIVFTTTPMDAGYIDIGQNVIMEVPDPKKIANQIEIK
tara:strand:+ start:668 stop:1108 length:441 start_codon:yes stop_codon:yes gene_type:complete